MTSPVNKTTCIETIKNILVTCKVTVLGELRKIVDYIEKHPTLIHILKISLAILITGGLMTASIFSFYFSIPLLISAVRISLSALTVPFLYTHIAMGLALSSMTSFTLADNFNMYEITNNNIKDVIGFVKASVLFSFVSIGLCTGVGASIRLRYMGFIGLSVHWLIRLIAGYSVIGIALSAEDCRP